MGGCTSRRVGMDAVFSDFSQEHLNQDAQNQYNAEYILTTQRGSCIE
jgi:hypothetical protein